MTQKQSFETVRDTSSCSDIHFYEVYRRLPKRLPSIGPARIVLGKIPTVVPAKSDSDIIFCLQLLSYILTTCTPHLR